MNINIHPQEQKGLVPSTRLEQLDLWMTRLVDQGVLPFAMTVLQKGDQLVYWRWYGMTQPENNLPAEPESVLRVYSMTKPVTVLTALLLEEQGLIDLEEPVETWIPELAKPKALRKPEASLEEGDLLETGPTLSQLMTHTSGYSYNAAGGSFLDQALDTRLGKKPSLNELLSTLQELPLAFPPGSAWRYGLGIDVLGMVLMRAAEKPLGLLMEELIFEPLEMKNTSFDLQDSQIPNHAHLYFARDGGGYSKIEDPFPGPSPGVDSVLPKSFPNHWGGAGLFSTPSDWMKFSNMLRKAFKGEENPVTTPDLARRMASNQLTADIASMLPEGPEGFREWMPFEGLGMGLGVWIAQDSKRLGWQSNQGEFGWGGVANTVFWIDPVSDSNTMFFTQVMPSSKLGLRVELHRLAASILN